MSDPVAIAYEDQQTAEQVLRTRGDLSKEKLIELDDAVVVTRDENGKVRLQQR